MRWILRAALVLTIAPCLLYSGGYVWARATHRLVHYSGGFISRPNFLSNWGYTGEQIAYLPAIWLEETVRGALDPSF